MAEEYQHLGPFSDWAWADNKYRPRQPLAAPGLETQKRVSEVLGFSLDDEQPREVRLERRWERDGLAGEEVSWWVGYGPRAHVWLLKPAAASGPLPGVLALHDHGGFKFFGKEKIADGPEDPPPIVATHRAEAYGGRAFANELAKEGFAVLGSDTFLWGSRRFPLEVIPESARLIAQTYRTWWFQASWPQEEIVRYNAASSMHEDVVERYCNILGTTLAGVVSYEDRVAANYLTSRPDVIPGRIGCIGLSGGGCRSALLQATCDRISAAVVVGMMSTYQGLLDHNVDSHTWMLFPEGWARHGDWADLAACRAPSPLLVQYNLQDELFTEEGMRAADQRLAGHYRSVGRPENYVGEFYPGLHKFDVAMQVSAFAWLRKQLQL